MGYRVDYRPIKKIRGAEKRRSGYPAMAALLFLLFLFLVNGFWPRGAEVTKRLLIPGDPEITTAALGNLATDLRAGTSLSGAVENFCITILQESAHDPD